MVESRVRVGGCSAVAIGIATLTPHGRSGFAAFALSPAGLAMVAILFSLAGEAIEEMGTLRRIRAGLVVRIAGAAVVVQAVAWRLSLGFADGAARFGEVLMVVGLVIVAHFVLRDARVLGDLRYGQSISLRRIGERDLEIRVARSIVTVPLYALEGITVGKTLARRGLLLAVEQDARIEGPVAKLPWVEERVDSRTLFLDEHQLGGDATYVAELIAAAKAREPGGYR